MVRPAAAIVTATSVLAVVLLVGGSAGSVAAAPTVEGAQSATPIDRCVTITEPGTYVLEDNRTFKGLSTSASCITIRANDVVIDGRGHVFAGHGTSNTTGIMVTGAENVTIRNVAVRDWHRGIQFSEASGGRVQDTTIEENAFGLTLRNTTAVTVENSRATGNLVAFRGVGDGDNTYRNVHVTGNQVAGVQDARRTNRFVDFDGDLLYEDVNGDGERDVVDALALFGLATENTFGFGLDGLSKDQIRALDFNGNGRLGYGDVFVYLF